MREFSLIPAVRPVLRPAVRPPLTKGVGVLRPANLVVAAIGDSLTAASASTVINGFTQQDLRGALPWTRGISSQKFYLPGAAIKGVGGETLAQILARITDVTAMSIAGPDGASVRPGTVVLQGGVNSVGSGASLVTTIADLESCIAAIRAAGQNVVILGPTPQSSGTTFTAGQLAILAGLRDYIRTRAQPSQGVLVADAWDDVASTPNGDVAAANMLYDATHWNAKAAFLVGQRLSTQLDRLFPSARPLAGTNLLANPQFAGAGGSVSGGITGTVATSWGAATTTLTGDQAIVASVVDIGGGNFAQQFAVTGTWASIGSLSINQTLSGWGTTYNIGDVMSCEMGFEIDLISPAPSNRIYGSAGLLYKSGGIVADALLGSNNPTPAGPVSMLGRIERFTLPADATRNTCNGTLTWPAGVMNIVARFKLPNLMKH